MTVNIVGLIRDYADFTDTTDCVPSKVKEIETYIARFFCIWTFIPPIERGGFNMSHTRSIYISDPNPLGKRWVIKMKTYLTRSTMLGGKPFSNRFPTTEEAAYEVVKLFGKRWKEIPKTRVFHQTQAGNSKYSHLLKPFIIDTEFPLTFAVQEYVNGKTLPDTEDQRGWALWETTNPVISRASFFRCYCINLILGRRDLRGDNILHNPETGDFVEIDNESLGASAYDKRGVLNHFTALKSEAIFGEILEDILKANPEQLERLKQKYIKRDLELFKLWEGELSDKNVSRIKHLFKQPKCIPAMIKDLKKDQPIQWRIISSHLLCIQNTIRSLNEKGEPVSLNIIESELSKLH
jgi:hypothetical protein